ncbi:UNVERIFIED_ORG: arsenate reductase-like glutaredoxin family protein [Shinella zoogloeoides]|nr:arsenate reductase-like glutaredoxin family protein [Shinella zoogloeoides]
MSAIIYHNAKCSTALAPLALIRAAGIEHRRLFRLNAVDGGPRSLIADADRQYTTPSARRGQPMPNIAPDDRC